MGKAGQEEYTLLYLIVVRVSFHEAKIILLEAGYFVAVEGISKLVKLKKTSRAHSPGAHVN